MNTRKSRLVIAVAATLATATFGNAQAAFFQLAENSASGLGNAFAGGAAVAEDASVVWYNPAGMTKLKGTEIVAVGHLIAPSIEFSKTSANLNALVGGGAISGGNGGDAGEAAFVPNIYFVMPLSERLRLGVGVNAPYGLATDYDDGWVGRYHADRSEIAAVNLNVSLGYKIADQFSVGAGINYQKFDAKLTQAVDYGSVCALAGVALCAAPGANDGSATVEADDYAFGYNLGLRWEPVAQTAIGLAYRSKLEYTLEGSFDVTAPSATAAAVGASAPFNIVDSGAKANVTMPATLSLSIEQKFGQNWTILADVTRTFWSDLPELRIDFDSAQADSVVTLGLDDVNRYSIGATFRPNNQWAFRAGLALDQTPTPSADLRTPRLPDADRTWLTFGLGYAPSPTLSFDVGYAYIKVDEAAINKTVGGLGTENFLRGSLVGNYDASTHVLSGQLRWVF